MVRTAPTDPCANSSAHRLRALLLIAVALPSDRFKLLALGVSCWVGRRTNPSAQIPVAALMSRPRVGHHVLAAFVSLPRVAARTHGAAGRFPIVERCHPCRKPLQNARRHLRIYLRLLMTETDRCLSLDSKARTKRSSDSGSRRSIAAVGTAWHSLPGAPC